MLHPAAAILQVASVPVLGVVAGMLGTRVCRRRAIGGGHSVTPLRSGIRVLNGVAVGLVAGVTISPLLAVALPPVV